MNRSLIGVAGLALGLSLLTGAATAGAANAPAPLSRAAYSVGAGLDAGTLYRMAGPVAQTSPQDCAAQPPDAAVGASDTDNVQDVNGPDAAEAAADASDADNLQCGDQTGSDGETDDQTAQESAGVQVRSNVLASAKPDTMNAQAAAQETPGTESADGTSETESAGNDQAVDGIDCVQTGGQQGENAGC